MAAGLLGQITTPRAGNRLVPGAAWCADNGVYGGSYPGDRAYLTWLAGHTEHAQRCAFVAAPDVVGNAAATVARSLPMVASIRALGFPAALVLQDGQESLPLPGGIDAVFVGGSTGWKLGPAAAELAARARRRGLWVHVGRVNTRRRLRYAAALGADSVDGTLLAHGPDIHLPRLLRWLAELDAQDPLWETA